MTKLRKLPSIDLNEAGPTHCNVCGWAFGEGDICWCDTDPEAVATSVKADKFVRELTYTVFDDNLCVHCGHELRYHHPKNTSFGYNPAYCAQDCKCDKPEGGRATPRPGAPERPEAEQGDEAPVIPTGPVEQPVGIAYCYDCSSSYKVGIDTQDYTCPICNGPLTPS